MTEKKQAFRYGMQELISNLLMLTCFPLNPLVMLDLIKPAQHKILTGLGIASWVIGMAFIIYPFIYFRQKGGVSKGFLSLKTNTLVSSGLYAIIRHVQYTGGILAIFLATPLLYPHWIFIALGIPGILFTYSSMKHEDDILIEKFGDAYSDYIDKVPAMNILTGLYRKLKNKIS